jgi:hypothetical protein
MERTKLPWRIAVEEKLAELSRFNQLLRPDERAAFEDLLAQCSSYATLGEVFTSTTREMSLLFWMIFTQHKRLVELEKWPNETAKPGAS